MEDLSSLNEPQAIPALQADTSAAGFTMVSDPLTCSLLRTLAVCRPGGKFLELGSGTGVSTAWILDGMDAQAQLTTIDNEPTLLAILQKHLGGDRRLTVVCADGDEFLQSLAGQKFDFIFADTWPGKYHLLDEALSLLRPGGIYAIDDMLPQPNWPEGHGEKVDRLIRDLDHRPDFRVVKMSWATGIILATKL
jgi:predicted O-methyltransferase YrrM